MNTGKFLNKVINHVFWWIKKTGILNKLDDETYLKLMYRVKLGKKLNLDHPQTFNEKLQWLKLYDRRPEYTKMVDKYEAKKYVAERIGDEYIIPTLGIWDQFDEIDFDALPEKFVLKCTHDSGSLAICKDKERFNKESVRKKIESALHRNYFYGGREWPYKNVHPRIMAEQYMENSQEAGDLPDYKFFCFNGIPKMTLVCSERFSKSGLKEDFYDQNWKHLNLSRPFHENSVYLAKKPENFTLMKELAAKLAKDIPFSRIDFYEVESKVYFGEITLFPANGLKGFQPEFWDMELGNWLELPLTKHK